MLQIGSYYAWLWAAVESIHIQLLGVYVFSDKSIILISESFRSGITIYGKYPVYSDGRSWYLEAGPHYLG